MKHLDKFENHDYLSLLKKTSSLKNEYEKDRYQFVSKNNLDQRNREEYQDRVDSENSFESRVELIHLVSNSLVFCDLDKPGFESFREELQNLLSKYPLEELPPSIYNNDGFTRYKRGKG